jgi:NitT/TauT family transport system substrate-binding protein
VARELSTNLAEEYANLSCCVVGVTGKLVREDKRVVAALTQRFEAHDYSVQHLKPSPRASRPMR